MSKNRLFLFELEVEGVKGPYRIPYGVRSMNLNGAVRKLYQTMPKEFREIKKILWEEQTMTIYIPEFWVGFMACIIAEVTAIVAYTWYVSRRKKR